MDNLKRWAVRKKNSSERTLVLETEREGHWGVSHTIQIEEGETSMQRVQLLKKKNRNKIYMYLEFIVLQLRIYRCSTIFQNVNTKYTCGPIDLALTLALERACSLRSARPSASVNAA